MQKGFCLVAPTGARSPWWSALVSCRHSIIRQSPLGPSNAQYLSSAINAITHLTELIIVFDEIEHNFDSALVDSPHFFVVILSQQIWSHNCGDIPCVHLVTSLFVHSVK